MTIGVWLLSILNVIYLTLFIGHNKMVANGKLHSLQKIIFFPWRCLGNTALALSECRALPIRQGAAYSCNSVDRFIIVTV